MSYLFPRAHVEQSQQKARVAVVSAKLQHSSRKELEYISEALGLNVEGKSDEQLRNTLIGMMS